MSKKKSSIRNPIVVAMNKRYGSTTTTMKDRRLSRPDDFKNVEGTYMDDIATDEEAPDELWLIVGAGFDEDTHFSSKLEADLILSKLWPPESYKNAKVVRYIKA